MNPRDRWEGALAFGASVFGAKLVEENDEREPGQGSRMICIRVEDNIIPALPDSQHLPCAECGELCLVSPSGVTMIAKFKVVVTCMQCAAQDGMLGPNPEFSRLQPEQLDDLARHEEWGHLVSTL